MIQETVSVDEVIRILNELVKLDPEAMSALFRTYVACNMEIGEHPTAQTHLGEYFGAMGLLNSFFGIDKDGWGAIVAMKNPDGSLIEFTRAEPWMKGFVQESER